jgi:hypothetical protein
VSDQHDWVRRLLARAGEVREPMPDDVATRLDDLVAELARGETAETHAEQEAGSTGPVVPMTPRRHRRWGAALLAAAAVSVGGYVVTSTALLDDLTGGQGSVSEDTASLDPAPDAGAGSPETGSVAGEVHDLSSRTLRADARRLVERVTPPAALRDQAGSESSTEGRDDGGDPAIADEARPRGPDGCMPPPAEVTGPREPVVLDGASATAVLTPRPDGSTLVTVWACARAERLARVVVAG